jgi:broad specificity phosphatase PhoE
MSPRRRLAASLLLAGLVVPAIGRAQTEGRLPEIVFVVRHAEKVTPTSEPGVALSPAGRQRAERLAALLKDMRITSVWATDTVRAKDTGTPAARERGLEVRTYPARDAAGTVSAAPLLELLRREGGSAALVVGHSDTVPKILAALGAADPPAIPDTDYDNLFVVVPSASGGAAVARLRY